MQKLALLLPLLLTHPQDFYDRVRTKAETWLDRMDAAPDVYEAQPWAQAVSELDLRLHGGLSDALGEAPLGEIEAEVRRYFDDNDLSRPFTLAHNADMGLARLQYALCRVLKPHVVVETGVAYGVSSAFILQALDVNQAGMLYSIDFPPLTRSEQAIGSAIPQRLRSRWHLERGVSRRKLPQLLATVSAVDVFIHDSLHTYRTMRYELQTIAPRLAQRAVVIVDDVTGNTAFAEWTASTGPAYCAVVREEKRSAFGVCLVDDAGNT